MDLGNDFYLIRFHLVLNYEKVLHGGPRFIGQHFLSIRFWEPKVNPLTADNKTTAIWARLPGLPSEFHDFHTLQQVGNFLGVLLKIDAHGHHATKGQFGRLCV